MSLWQTETPNYATQPDNPTAWQWLQSLIGPAAMHGIRRAAACSDTDLPSQLRTWLRALTRTGTPAYHVPARCEPPGKSPDEPGK